MESLIDKIVSYLTSGINLDIVKIDSETKKEEKPEKDSKLPAKIQSAINKLKTDWGVVITQSHIDKEFEQEGSWRDDAGSVNQDALTNINKLIKDCNSKFGNLGGVKSGYRSYDDQVKNFGKKVKNDGRTIDNVQASNTIPGFSEHHTGKAFDIFSVDTSWWNSRPKIKDWVANNSEKYGFKVTYKEQGPLRSAEPWHLYYIGGESISESISNVPLQNQIIKMKKIIYG